MSDPDRTIRDARHAELKRRNNPWCEPPYAPSRRTDAKILAGVPDTLEPSLLETQEQRIKRRLRYS